MDDRLAAILARLFWPDRPTPGLPILDSARWLADDADPVARIAAAFLVVVAGPTHPDHDRGLRLLGEPPAAVGGFAAFLRTGLDRLEVELARVTTARPEVAARFDATIAGLDAASTVGDSAEAIWRTFFPQAVGILGHETDRIRALRDARTVIVTRPAPDPITDPAREILFTANVLLTIPAPTTDIAGLPYPAVLREVIAAAACEPQRRWFDHPIQVGVEPVANELLWGLRGLDAAVAAEPAPVAAEPGPRRITCLLSVSVTHDGLGPIARAYVEAELARAGGLEHVDVVVVTEADAQRLVNEILVPALAIGDDGSTGPTDAATADRAAGLSAVVGVDGEYGRHYSFLKAIAALWNVAIDLGVRATFKVDLDQVFPQQVLVAETGCTAFGHLSTPLWGATAIDSEGREIELGLIAGALVNERDIGTGLYTPDVDLPGRWPTADEQIFWSTPPQAISTRAEMMERYDGPAIDGVSRALERIHVTGGTNGIRVDALRRHRPFTPTFVGRAEDQAYILSTLGQPGPRLAYAHAAGLIMRHDKEAFAGEAMAAAHVGKLVGDDVRIVAFSAYADTAAGDGTDGALDRAAIGRLLDPFTGGFASAIPVTVVLLRIALRTIGMVAAGRIDQAHEYASLAAERVGEAIDRFGDAAVLADRVCEERAAWDHYYDALDALEGGLASHDARATKLRRQAVAIIDACRIAR